MAGNLFEVRGKAAKMRSCPPEEESLPPGATELHFVWIFEGPEDALQLLRIAFVDVGLAVKGGGAGVGKEFDFFRRNLVGKEEGRAVESVVEAEEESFALVAFEVVETFFQRKFRDKFGEFFEDEGRHLEVERFGDGKDHIANDGNGVRGPVLLIEYGEFRGDIRAFKVEIGSGGEDEVEVAKENGRIF